MRNVTLCLCMVVVTSGFIVLIADIHQTLGRTDTAIMQMSQDLHEVSAQAKDVLGKVNDAAQTFKDASEKNAKYYDQASRQTAGTVKALRLLIDRTDKSLNDGTLPAATDLIRSLQFNSGVTFTRATGALQELQDTTGKLGSTIDTFNDQLRSDRLVSIAGNLDRTSAQLAEATEHANNTLASVDKTAAYYQKKLTTPQTFAKKVLWSILDVGSKLGSIAAGFAH